jgi:2-polyprenyl-3-methyl-5-hydroxy-6-metoxy-1,4-benzoquinol methylase
MSGRKEAPDYFGWDRREMLRYLPAGTARLLDVGCARGRFGALARGRLGAEVWGIEPDEGAAMAAERVLDRVVRAGVWEALALLPRGYFDCVVFNDVLEHLVDPYRLLAEIKAHLAPGGVVVASIPNVRHYPVLRDLVLRGEWEYVDLGVLDRTHLRFFTRRSIRRMFAEQGYEVLRMEGINASRVGRVVAPLLPAAISDLPYQQFACVARPGIGEASG